MQTDTMKMYGPFPYVHWKLVMKELIWVKMCAEQQLWISIYEDSKESWRRTCINEIKHKI